MPENSAELVFLLLLLLHLPTYDSFDSYCHAPFNSKVFVCLLLSKSKTSDDSKCDSSSWEEDYYYFLSNSVPTFGPYLNDI